MPFLDWLQNTQLATWISQSDSVWVYPSVLSMHTIGLGVLVGISAAVDLRVLGFASRVPLAPLERFFPIMWAGFWINAVSGAALFAAAATTKGTQWIFYVKLLLVAHRRHPYSTAQEDGVRQPRVSRDRPARP